MPIPEGTAVLVADDHENEAVYSSIEEGVVGIRVWFHDVLEASCQGLSDEGIEETFPGLLARLRDGVASVPVSAATLTVDQLAGYGNAVAEKVLALCLNDHEREAVGVPAQFSVRAANRLEVPDVAALAELAKRR